jgi:hypothetical protein
MKNNLIYAEMVLTFGFHECWAAINFWFSLVLGRYELLVFTSVGQLLTFGFSPVLGSY